MNKIKYLYEIFMFLTIIIAVGTIWYESEINFYILWFTWFIFLIDYLVCLVMSDKKWDFIKKNPFDLIALIPLDAFFQIAKFAKLYRLIRLKTIAKKYSNPLIAFMEGKQMKYIIPISFFIMVISTIPFYFFEPLVDNFKDAFIWSVGSFLIFGYKDLSPETEIGRVVVVSLTILGISIHTILMGLIINILKSKISKNE
jgi:voltage-gated potassium channel